LSGEVGNVVYDTFLDQMVVRYKAATTGRRRPCQFRCGRTNFIPGCYIRFQGSQPLNRVAGVRTHPRCLLRVPNDLSLKALADELASAPG